jgi:hypothetical protein
VGSLPKIIANLARAQNELLRAADEIPAEQWKIRPVEGRWSAGELIVHLSAVERFILGRTDKLLQNSPKSVPFYKRFHLPMKIVEARVIRRKAPAVVEPQMPGERNRRSRNCAECASERWHLSTRRGAATSASTTSGIHFWGT